MSSARSLIAPAALGLGFLIIWEAAVRGIPISPALLPPPSIIGAKFAAEIPTLAYDFSKTVIEAVIPAGSSAMRRGC